MSNKRCAYSKKLLKKIKSLNQLLRNKVDISAIRKAIWYAKKCHAGQFRNSGEPYYTHPLEVAYMVCDYCFKTDVIITAILHDTIEDTDATIETISDLFGVKIAQDVMDLTRDKENGIRISADEMVNSLWVQKKYDLLMIKQFDRLHNMRTLGAKSLEKIEKTIKETIITFTVLAAHLEIKHVEEEIIKLCSQFIDQTPMDENYKISKSDAYLLSLVLDPSMQSVEI